MNEKELQRESFKIDRAFETLSIKHEIKKISKRIDNNMRNLDIDENDNYGIKIQ